MATINNNNDGNNDNNNSSSNNNSNYYKTKDSKEFKAKTTVWVKFTFHYKSTSLHSPK